MRPRQRIRLRRSALTVLGQLVAALIGLGLLWDAVVVGAVAVGVDSSTVSTVTGYDAVHGWVSGLSADGVQGATVRLAVGLGGLVAAVALALMARAQLPAPRLTPRRSRAPRQPARTHHRVPPGGRARRRERRRAAARGERGRRALQRRHGGART